MASGGHEGSWLMVVIVVVRECFTTSRIKDRFPKQVMLCLREAASGMHPPQKAASIPTLLSNTLGTSVSLILKDVGEGGIRSAYEILMQNL
jgi:hypothetical protein